MITLARTTSFLLNVPRSRPALRPIFASRTYALSRFPERNTGSSRQRRRVTARERSSKESSENETTSYEERPSSAESLLWVESQRGPFSDPEDGLKRLLLGNDELVVTRWAKALLLLHVLSSSSLPPSSAGR